MESLPGEGTEYPTVSVLVNGDHVPVIDAVAAALEGAGLRVSEVPE